MAKPEPIRTRTHYADGSVVTRIQFPDGFTLWLDERNGIIRMSNQGQAGGYFEQPDPEKRPTWVEGEW